METQPRPLPDKLRDYFMQRRRSIITELAELEDMLGLPRSIPPKKQREER